MEKWMGGAMLIEATLLSFGLALWLSWMVLRGLFRLMPATRMQPAPQRAEWKRAETWNGRRAA